nr:hypothetical protein JDDFFMMN_00055 [Klebsiella pneumoniae]
MGAKPRQSQGVGVGLAVDQQQVGLDVAFAVARPIAGKIVVAVSHIQGLIGRQRDQNGTVAKLAMRQPFVLFKGLTFQKLCLPGAFRPGDHHNKMLRPGLCVVHASPQYL